MTSDTILDDNAARWTDWNRMELDFDGDRTMREVTAAAMHVAGDREAVCPLCTDRYPVDELAGHVGSVGCARSLLDGAVLSAIGCCAT